MMWRDRRITIPSDFVDPGVVAAIVCLYVPIPAASELSSGWQGVTTRASAGEFIFHPFKLQRVEQDGDHFDIVAVSVGKTWFYNPEQVALGYPKPEVELNLGEAIVVWVKNVSDESIMFSGRLLGLEDASRGVLSEAAK